MLSAQQMIRSYNNPTVLRGQRTAWCFTINNPHRVYATSTTLMDQLKADERVRYVVFQEELSPSGTPHYQGYIEFKRSVR